MSYTDSDILDLYTDLHTVGATETPEEEAQRHSEFLWSCQNLAQAAEVLELKGIPHTYYRIEYKFSVKDGTENGSATWILFKGMPIFRTDSAKFKFCHPSAGSLIRIFKSFYDDAWDFHYDKYQDLPQGVKADQS